MNAAFISLYADESMIQQFEGRPYINYFIDVRSACPSFYDESMMKFIVNDESSCYLYLAKSLYNLLKYVDYHIGLTLKYKSTPRFFFFSDTGVSQFHLQIDKDYKANRKHASVILTESEYKRSKQLQNALLLSFKRIITQVPGCFYIHLGYVETDFIPYYILSNFNFSDDEAFIIKSNDKDLAQVLSLKTSIYQLLRHRKFGKVLLPSDKAIPFHMLKSLTETTKQPAHLIPIYLSIAGDSSDNIQGIRGVGYKTLHSLLETIDYHEWTNDNFENLNILLNKAKPKTKRSEKILQLIQDNLGLVEKNLRLTDFKYMSEHISSTIVSDIHKAFKVTYKLSESDIRNFVSFVKQLTNNDNAYFYNIVQLMKSCQL